jgi:hypothetical protein
MFGDPKAFAIATQKIPIGPAPFKQGKRERGSSRRIRKEQEK